MAAIDHPALPPAAPAPLGWPLSALPGAVRLSLLLIAAGTVAIVGVIAARSHPQTPPPVGTELERQLAEVFHDHSMEFWDSAIIGDLLVERFYILDLLTGERYAADLLKGRIDGVEVVQREDQVPANVFVLNTRDMRRDRAFYNAYVRAVSRPDQVGQGAYLGLITPSGDRDAFPVNYNGEIPAAYAPFHTNDDSDPYTYMLRQNFKAVTSPWGLSVAGYTYVLSTSDLLPVFKNEFKLERTMFVSELLIVDTTARQNKTTYYKLLDQFPRSP